MSAPSEKHRQMMSSGVPCPVVVHSDTEKSSAGEVRVQQWDKKERSRRSLKFWLYCWVLAFVSVIIPLAHFVLVPAFLLAGPVGAWIISTQSSAILGGESTCPDCGTFLPLSPAADNWPLKDLCASCQRRMRIEKA